MNSYNRQQSNPVTTQLRRYVRKKVADLVKANELGKDTHFEVTNDGVACMCEVVMKYAELFAKDLEAFSAHAKRTTVTPQDVRLVARRQPSIVSKLDEIVSVLEEEKRKKRKKNDTTLIICLTKN